MRTFLTGSALAAAALGSGSAAAADVATIGCVQWRMPAAARTALIADLRRNLLAPKGVEHSYSEAARGGMASAAAACAKQYGWSDAARPAAILYAMAAAGEPVSRDVAKQVGLNYEQLAARVADLPASDLLTGAEGPGLRKVAQASEAAKEITLTNSRPAGAIYALLLITASSLAKFARS